MPEFELPAALALLGFVPLIVALYLMRSRPRRHVVSSNHIWEMVLRRKREQSLLGRFRNSIFLFLHLLMAILAALVLAQPTLPGGIQGDSLFIVDTSASMGATDEAGCRLEEARRRVRELVLRLDPGAKAALIEAGLHVLPVVEATTDRHRFLRALDGLTVTDSAGPDPAELTACLLAGSQAHFARTCFFTDNCPSTQLAELPFLGALSVRTVGRSGENLGVASLEITDLGKGKELAAQFRNFGPLPSRCKVSLRRADSTIVESRELTIAGGASQAATFRGHDLPPGPISLKVEPTGSPDYLACDDVAWAVLGARARKVLLLDRPGSPLAQLLASSRLGLEVVAGTVADTAASPARLEPFDLIVSNGRYGPALASRNLLLFAACGPDGPAAGAELRDASLVFTDQTHAAMKYLSFDEVKLHKVCTLPGPGRPLLATAEGPVMKAIEGSGFRQLVAGFTLENTDLAYRVTFPILVANAVNWVTGAGGLSQGCLRVGDSIRLPATQPGAELFERGKKRTLEGLLEGGRLTLSPFLETGLVQVRTDAAKADFGVNLFSLSESQIQPARQGFESEAPTGGERGRRPVWREGLWLLLALLLVEWFLWHRLGG